MNHCWRSMKDACRGKGELKECEKSSCCYTASAQAVFEYWKFAHGEKWKEILKKELERVEEDIEP